MFSGWTENAGLEYVGLFKILRCISKNCETTTDGAENAVPT